MYIYIYIFIETFADNSGLTLDPLFRKSPFFIVATGDSNGKTTNWYKNYTSFYEGIKIFTITY